MSNVRIQDDLYEHVNGDWLAAAVIPEDRPTTGGFNSLAMDVEKWLMADFKAFANQEKTTNVEYMEDAICLYQKVLDTQARNSKGIQPIMPLLNKIKAITSIEELNAAAKELLLSNVELPFNCFVDADMQDATKNSFIILGPSIILPDTTYYQENNETGKQLLEVYVAMARKALSYTDLSEEEQEQFIQDMLAFDANVAKQVKSQLEWADYVKNHNPVSLDTVVEQLKPFDFKALLTSLYQDALPQEVIIYDPKAIEQFKTYFNKEMLHQYIHWAYVRTLLGGSSALSLELAENGTLYHRILVGIEKDPVLEKQAYQVASKYFSEPIGVYYGREYFGEEAKKDIISLVKRIIEAWKERVAKNTFLEEATKEKAILKLSTITIKMGYPDSVDPFYGELQVNSEDSYFDAVSKIKRAKISHNFDKLWKPVDKNEWLMPGHLVNACYDPSRNDITFPAAILQAPFYSIKQTISENLGGIGAVISHEISHAFDNNGAHFDEFGNLNNWWTEKDLAAFDALTKDMIAQWDGIPYCGGIVNGELVVSENIADNGGIAVTIQIMHTLENPSFEEYFKNWAKVWCMKAKDQYIQFLLVNDVHSPAKLRANIQVRNFKEWYDTFGVTEHDQMYIPEEKRLLIW